MGKLDEVKDRVNGRGVGIYDEVCRHHDVKWLIEQAEKLDKLQYEASRTEDIILTYAREKDLKDFCEKWNTKLYSDSDHNIPNMILDFLHAIEE